MNHIPFNLERARAGDAIQTVEGRERRLIAYLPDRRHHLRVVVLDPKADRLYSHSESGEHCELVASLKLVMKPVKEPAATKQSTISPEIREELLKIVREVFEPKPAPVAKVVRWLGAYQTKVTGEWCVTAYPYAHESQALFRAKIATETGLYVNPRAIRIEL